jgi:hypothetical protein
MFALSIFLVVRAAGLARVARFAVVVAVVAFIAYAAGALELDGLLTSHLTSVENTRSEVWDTMWNLFLENPVFGADIIGTRLGFGESSWLAIAADTGVIGLGPLLLFGFSSLNMMYRLRVGSWDHATQLRASVVIAGMASLLAGSIFEAYLLATLSAPIFLVMLYSILGYALLNAERIRRSARFGGAPRPFPDTQSKSASAMR